MKTNVHDEHDSFECGIEKMKWLKCNLVLHTGKVNIFKYMSDNLINGIYKGNVEGNLLILFKKVNLNIPIRRRH